MLKSKTLPERIAELRAEADAFIDRKAEELGKENPGVPVGVVRNLLTNRTGGCQCQAVQNLMSEPR